MKKLLIVDGSNLLFQMFYGMPARIVNAKGRPIQGTLGFVGALLKILRMTNPTHAAVFFDGECENERTDIDSAYKANRPGYSQIPDEDTPFSQLPDIYAALDYLGICHGETIDCEADDWIAGYARNAGAETQVVISSMDSDFFQLISRQVHVLRYRGKESVLCDPEYIRNRLGIEPEQYADFKSLTGDTADNIKGAKGIGPKTAAALMREFGSLENLLLHVQAVSKPSVRAAVMNNAQRLERNSRLIHLTGSHKLPFPMDSLKYTDPGLTTIQVLQAIGLR